MKKIASETHNTAGVMAGAGASVAPGTATAKKAGGKKKSAPKSTKTAARGKSNKPVKPAKNALRKESKGATILEMMGRPKGAMLAAITAATGWQAHSVRGFISTARKKHDLKIESAKNDAGQRVYRTGK